MNEVNALIWPNRLGVGVMDPAAFKQTAKIANDVQGHQEAGDEGRVPQRPREEGGREAEEEGRRRPWQGLQERRVVLKEGGEVTRRVSFRADCGRPGACPHRAPERGGE